MKKRYMFLLAFIIAVFASFSASAAGNAAINISSAEGEVGDEVQVSVKLSSEMKLCFVGMKITYDTTALELVSASITDSLSGGFNTNTKLAWADLGGHIFNDDTVFDMTFKILDTAQAGSSYELNAEFDPEEDFIDDQDNSVVPFVAKGSITVKEKSASAIALSASVSMKENFDLNLYIRNIPQGEESNYTLRWTFDGNLYGESFEKNLGDLTRQSDGRYRLVLHEVFSYQMSHLFHITLWYKDALVREFDYSVRQCLENRYKKNEFDKDVCRAALNYGAAAQAYFDGKSFVDANGRTFQYDTNLPGNAANMNLSETDRAVNAQKPSNVVATSGAITGISKKTVSLILGTETSLKFLFNYENEIGNLSISVNHGKDITGPLRGGDGRYYAIVKGISSFELYKDLAITINADNESSTLVYAPYTYAAKYWDSEDELTKNLCRALVDFGDAAKELWAD